MSWKLAISMLAGVCVVAMLVAWTKPFARSGQQATANSVVRYATDDFLAACYVRPKELINHSYFSLLPIHTSLPHPLSLGRLDSMDVQELVVLCRPATDEARHSGRQTNLEWAAVARTSNPIDLATVSREWRRSLVPPEEAETKSETLMVGNHECFRVRAGTFFPPYRRYGQLRFTDRMGQSTDLGVNVGNEYEYRSYVEAGTEASAIFTFDGLDEDALVDGHLPLELTPAVFLVRLLDNEYGTAQIELRNPDNGLRSEPIKFEPKSFVNQRLSVPRTLAAIDSGETRLVDLLNDLVSRGRLEVILKAIDPGMYLGVGVYDLNLRPSTFEYVFVSDREIVVTQSSKTLKTMLAASPGRSSLARRLSEPNAAIAIIASVRGPGQRVVLQQLAHATIGNGPLAMLLGKELTDITATASADGLQVCQVTAEFTDRRKAREARSQFNQAVRTLKEQADVSIADSLNRLDTIGSLTSLGLGGVSMSFPEGGSPEALARAPEILSLMHASLDSIEAEAESNVLTIHWRQPASLSESSGVRQFALANMEEALAWHLFSRELFDLGDEMYRRVTHRLPHVPQAWFRRAHQLAYNVSIEFDGYENRYAWVRRGLDVLLDGAEENPDKTDLIWMLARFVGWKVGDADDRISYRELFSQDERLHERIARIVDLGPARSPDNKIDNWLVAKLLFENCIDRQATNSMSSAVPPVLFSWGPAAAQAGYAQSLSEAGHWSEALLAWKEAERLYGELGVQQDLVQDSQRIDFTDFVAPSADFDQVPAKRLEFAKRQVQHQYWLMRCKLEQDHSVQLTRKLSQEAAEHARRSDLRKAYDRYQQSLQALSEVRERRPTEMAQFAREFRHLARGYRKVAEQLDESAEVPSIIMLIEESQPASKAPLLDVSSPQ